MENSIWTKNANIPSFRLLAGNVKTDVLIVGGGIAGILCAKLLSDEGVDCCLIEADSICHGVTRNTTAKLTSQHGLIYDKLLRRYGADAAAAYWRANEAALAQYRNMTQRLDCDFETKDNFVYAVDSAEKLEREMRALERIGANADFLTNLPLPFPAAGAVRFRNQAQFHPLKFLSAIAKELPIYEHTPAREFVGNTVITDRGTITASAIIIATHFPILNKHGGYFLKMYQQRSYVLALKNAPRIDGMYLDAEKNGLSFRNYGDLLLLGGGGHRTGKRGGGWAELEDCARRFYPDGQLAARWATQDCMTLDGIPYIGRYSSHTKNLYVATGFNKWGMTSSMVSAMILRDLVQGRVNPYADVFSPSRTMLHPQLLVNALESAAHLLKPTRPRCPHLGCALTWNPQERSWDCPCHGSRFSETGKLLDNPATGDLDL